MKKVYLCFLAAVLLTACSPSGTQLPAPTLRPVAAVTLTPYAGAPSTSTPSLTPANTPTPLPTATPTPRLHMIRRGEDLFGIALYYGISLQDLLTANPTVNPYALRIGDQLVVPAAQYTPTLDPRNPPSPTPVGLNLPQPDCYPTQDDGIWCFALLSNPQTFDVEGVSAVFRLYDRLSGQIFSQNAYPPLNRLAAGGVLPLAVFFPPPAPVQFDAGMELLTALPIPAESKRYREVEITQDEISLSEDGLLADARGSLRLSGEEDGDASVVVVAAVALDAQDRVVGVRRWESDQPLMRGQTLSFHLRVYTSSNPIVRVILLAEAVP
ncbi:LysM peptidoglycan-binding domain-containing protein [Bellilinea sp.]|uniref:LysM peptidoglycan-binding domain-containing protein n=1 Tax=Bellilinea caldifistulae TaxID=360411 RepID=A0A7C4Q3V8_9CHLR|nr:LysM peptidoglycan-binding domain-containing protein [Bellilinea sp.]